MSAVVGAGDCSRNYGRIYQYQPPSWAKNLKVKPKVQAKLTMTPTPIHSWKLPGVPEIFEVSVKREDMIGCTLSGNKIRKLEFLLADAIDQGCDCVVTIGGYLSNHVRATVSAARELGLQSHVMIVGMGQKADDRYKANYMLSRLMGTKFVFFAYTPGIDYIKKAEEYITKLREEGHKPYMIPMGGSSVIGTWGYIDGFDEMMQQGVLDRFDDIVVTVGSVGTLCGLAISKYLTGATFKIHGVSVHKSEETILAHIDHTLQTYGLEDVKASDLVEVSVDYTGVRVFEDAGKSLETIVDVTSHTGVPIDPVFNMKSVIFMRTEMQKHPERFKGNRVLYIHSGGVYNLFGEALYSLVDQNPVASQIVSSDEVF